MEDNGSENLHRIDLWLKENVTVVPEPHIVKLSNFSIDWSRWSGNFFIAFDNLVMAEPFSFNLDLTGLTKFHEPVFVSPLGVPASYAAIKMTPKTEKAILAGLSDTFPKLKPLGKSQKTGVEITYNSPITDRISQLELSQVRSKLGTDYTITVRLDDL